MPNSDAGGGKIRRAIKLFRNVKNIKILTHVERNLFLFILSSCDLLLGNSSSGIIEAGSFGVTVINVGKRQNLRERNENVIDVKINDDNLLQNIKNQLAHGKYDIKNVYEQSNTCKKIVRFLSNLNIKKDMLNKVNTY